MTLGSTILLSARCHLCGYTGVSEEKFKNKPCPRRCGVKMEFDCNWTSLGYKRLGYRWHFIRLNSEKQARLNEF
jgi:hypothetical protein